MRILNYGQVTSIRKEQVGNLIRKFVRVKGIVTLIEDVKAVVQQMSFTCSECHLNFELVFRFSEAASTLQCLNVNCQSKNLVKQKDGARYKIVQVCQLFE